MTPVDWAAVSSAFTAITAVAVRVIIPGIRTLQVPGGGGNGTKAMEARLAGGDAATLLSEVRENRRQVEETHEIVVSLARTAERSAALLEQTTALAVKTDSRFEAISEATQAMSRMLQLHTGLLDQSVLKLDALQPAPPKKRGKR